MSAIDCCVHSSDLSCLNVQFAWVQLNSDRKFESNIFKSLYYSHIEWSNLQEIQLKWAKYSRIRMHVSLSLWNQLIFSLVVFCVSIFPFLPSNFIILRLKILDKTYELVLWRVHVLFCQKMLQSHFRNVRLLAIELYCCKQTNR